jgi:hypothetical protein
MSAGYRASALHHANLPSPPLLLHSPNPPHTGAPRQLAEPGYFIHRTRRTQEQLWRKKSEAERVLKPSNPRTRAGMILGPID